MQYLVLAGGNIGNTTRYISHAFSALEQCVGRKTARSAFYRSEPWGFRSGQHFINAAILLQSDLDPESMLRKLLLLEHEAGRVRDAAAIGYSARTLDLDLLFAGNIVYNSKDLELPHPRMHIRRFALMPAAELLPGYIHPVLKQTLQQLLDTCTDEGRVEKTA